MLRLLRAASLEPYGRQLLQQVLAPGAATSTCTSVSSNPASFSSHAELRASHERSACVSGSAEHECSSLGQQHPLHRQGWGGHPTTYNSSNSSSSSSSAGRSTLWWPHRMLLHSPATAAPAAGFHTSAASPAAAKRSSAASKARSKSKPKGTIKGSSSSSSSSSRGGVQTQLQQQQQPRRSRLPTSNGVTYLPKPARLLLRVMQHQAVQHDSPHLYRIARLWHPYTFTSYPVFRKALRQLKQLKLVHTVRPLQVTRGDPDRWVWTTTAVGAAVALPPVEFQWRVEQRVKELQEAAATAAAQAAAAKGALVPVQAA